MKRLSNFKNLEEKVTRWVESLKKCDFDTELVKVSISFVNLEIKTVEKNFKAISTPHVNNGDWGNQ